MTRLSVKVFVSQNKDRFDTNVFLPELCKAFLVKDGAQVHRQSIKKCQG